MDASREPRCELGPPGVLGGRADGDEDGLAARLQRGRGGVEERRPQYGRELVLDGDGEQHTRRAGDAEEVLRLVGGLHAGARVGGHRQEHRAVLGEPAAADLHVDAWLAAVVDDVGDVAGSAVGAWLAGLLVEHSGVVAALACAPVAAALGLLLALAGRRAITV